MLLLKHCAQYKKPSRLGSHTPVHQWLQVLSCCPAKIAGYLPYNGFESDVTWLSLCRCILPMRISTERYGNSRRRKERLVSRAITLIRVLIRTRPTYGVPCACRVSCDGRYSSFTNSEVPREDADTPYTANL